MAALPPHETLPRKSMTLEEFCDTAYAISETQQELIEDWPPSYHVASLALCGRWKQDDGTVSRLFLEEPAVVDTAELNEGTYTTQHVGTITGIVDNLDLDADLAVYPLPLSRERMKNPLRIKLEITTEGTASWVLADKVPHILVGTSQTHDLKVWMCFPKIYFRGCSTYIWEKWLESIYDCMRQALNHHSAEFRGNAARGIWKASYCETEKGASVQWDKAISRTVVVKKDDLQDFSTAFRSHVVQHDLFQNAIFVVHYTPAKNQADHSNPRAVRNAFRESTSIIRDSTNQPGWTAQGHLEFSKPGHTLLWREHSWAAFVGQVLPDIPHPTILERLSHSSASWTTGPTEWSPAHGSISLGELDNGGYTKMEFGFEDSADIPRGGAWRVYTTGDTFPNNVASTVRDVTVILDILRKRARNNNLKGGYTTVAITMPLGQARKVITLGDQSKLFCAVANSTWWEVKYWRARGVRTLLQRLEWLPLQFRGKRQSLLATGALAIHILNTVIIPQVVTTDLNRLLDLAVLKYIPDVDDDDEDAIAFGWADEAAVPALGIRGLYFMAGINPLLLTNDTHFYEVAGLDGSAETSRVDWPTLVGVHGLASQIALQAIFGIMSPTVGRISGAKTKRLARTDTTVAQVWFNPEWRPLISFADPRLAAIRLDAQATVVDDPTPEYILEEEEDSTVQKILSLDSISAVLSEILYQLAHDIMARAPNRALGGSTYVTLSKEEQERVPWALLQQATLPLDAAHLADVTDAAFDAIIARFIPAKGYQRTKKATGFDAATYLRAWCAVLNALGNKDAEVVTEVMRKKLKLVKWLPRATETAMWTTAKASGITRNSCMLPADTTENAPSIAVNPRSITGRNKGHFKLRDEAAEKQRMEYD